MESVYKRPEILSPAGSFENLKIAVRYGADAVYLGGSHFSLRSAAKNFSDAALAEAIRYAHAAGARVYVAANVFAHDRDLEEAAAYFRFLEEAGPDGVLISDPGMFRILRENAPSLPVHISTQANNTNRETFLFWYGLGVRRIVAARELTLSELTGIRAAVPGDLTIEAFVHGAMCISYSGRCLLSSVMTGRDANAGSCTHPCRWTYRLVEEKRPGEYFPVFEDDRGTTILHSKDLCMIDALPELLSAGVGSLKIEGRMRSGLYVAQTTASYRKAVDLLLADPGRYEAEKEGLLRLCENGNVRPFTHGFYFGRPDGSAQIYEKEAERAQEYLGVIDRVDEDGYAHIRQKNKFSEGDAVEVLLPDGTVRKSRAAGMHNAAGETISSAPHPGEEVCVRLDGAEEGLVVRRQASGA